MKIVTFNIRYDCGWDGCNNFCCRKPFILEKLNQEKPDIICFQEVLPHVADWLEESLSEYYVVGCGRSETLEGEQMTICYRKDGIKLLGLETWWLSETPYVPGSRYPDQSDCPRVCTEALFQEKDSRLVFRVANTHLDVDGQTARVLGLRRILEKLEHESLFPNAPVIITGDMNAEPDSEIGDVMKEYPYRNVTEGIGVTYHGFGKAEPPVSIDYILVKGFVCEKTEKWTDEWDGVYLSDHYPVCAVLKKDAE